MPWFEITGDKRLTERCATEGCGGAAFWRLEEGGVGSYYCSRCKDKIEEAKLASDRAALQEGRGRYGTQGSRQ